MKSKTVNTHNHSTSCRYWQALLVPLLLVMSLQAMAASPPPPEQRKPATTIDPQFLETNQPVGLTPAKPDLKSLTPGKKEVVTDTGTHFIAKDLPESKKPERSAPTRSHIQGELMQHQKDADSSGTTLYKKVPINGPSTRPSKLSSKEDSRAVGDSLRIIEGIDDTGWNPPDMVLAAGPEHVVEAVNSGFAIYTKLGTELQGYTAFSSFLSTPANWEGFMFDPRIVYDPYHEKFVMLALGRDDVNLQSYMWISASETSDPTEGWCTRRINVTNNSGISPAWLDYAGLAADQWGVYVTGNYYYWSGGSPGSSLRSYDEDIFSPCGTPLNGWSFTNLQWPSGGQAFSLQPALAHSINTDEETFFVNAYSAGGDRVMLSKLSGPRGNSPTLTRVEIDIAPYSAIGNNVDQPGSSTDIDGGSTKIMNAVYVNRRVFFTMTDDVNNDGTSSGWLTVKLDTDLNTNDWQHLLWFAEGTYLFFPALTYQGSISNSNLAIFGSWTDNEFADTINTNYASGVMKIYENHTVDDSGPFQVVAPGIAPFVDIADDGRNRWGDYSGASYDWECRNAWGVMESADTGNRWNTTINARQFANEPPCPLIELTNPAGGEVLSSGTVHTLTWQSSGLPPTDEIYLYMFSAEFGAAEVAGPLPSSATSYDWLVPESPSDEIIMAVGSWTGSDYSVENFGDAFQIIDATPPAPNPGRFAIAPVAQNTSQLYMEAVLATDGSGGPVEYSFPFLGSPTGGSAGSDSGWIPDNSTMDSLLETNQEYCYATRSQDENENITSTSLTRCAYTLASEPDARPGLVLSDTKIRVSWGVQDNPDHTEYLAQNITLGTVSGWITENSWIEEGLTEGNAYAYRVRARNGDNKLTDWVALGIYQTYLADADGDGIAFAMDNCVLVPNAAQRDTDFDGFGNACDPDLDQNGVVNFLDIGIWAPFFGTNTNEDMDFNGDGNANFLDYSLFPEFILQPPGPSGVILQGRDELAGDEVPAGL